MDLQEQLGQQDQLVHKVHKEIKDQEVLRVKLVQKVIGEVLVHKVFKV
jgi:hypothetical protein